MPAATTTRKQPRAARSPARGEIYTIGYDHLKPIDLVKALDGLKIELLIDCRSKPWSRIPGYDKASLVRLLGDRYEWRGNQLGGMGTGAQPAAVAALARETRKVVLMCKEEAPANCHRHGQIAVPLYQQHGVDCIHIYQDELVRASELDRAIEADEDYAYERAPWFEGIPF